MDDLDCNEPCDGGGNVAVLSPNEDGVSCLGLTETESPRTADCLTILLSIYLFIYLFIFTLTSSRICQIECRLDSES